MSATGEAAVHAALLANQYLLLGLVLTLLWIVLPGSGLGHALAAVLITLPLAAPLPALWGRRRRAAVWGGFLLAPYLAIGVMEAVANPDARLPAGLVTAAALGQVGLLIAWWRLARGYDPAA